MHWVTGYSSGDGDGARRQRENKSRHSIRIGLTLEYSYYAWILPASFRTRRLATLPVRFDSRHECSGRSNQLHQAEDNGRHQSEQKRTGLEASIRSWHKLFQQPSTAPATEQLESLLRPSTHGVLAKHCEVCPCPDGQGRALNGRLVHLIYWAIYWGHYWGCWGQ